MAMTLDDVTLEIMQSNEHLDKIINLKSESNDILIDMQAALDMVTESVIEMSDRMVPFSDSEQPIIAPPSDSDSSPEEEATLEETAKQTGLLSGLLNFFVGNEEEQREDDKREDKQNNLLAKIADYSRGFVKGLENLEGKAADSLGLLGALGAAALLFFDPQTLIDIVVRITEFFAAIVGETEKVIDSIGALWNSDDPLGSLMNIGGAIVDSFMNIFDKFQTEVLLIAGFIALRFNLVSKALKFLPKLFGKLFLPITIITGVIGGIIESVDEFKKGDIVGGIREFIAGALGTIVGAPLDLLKSAVSFLAGAMGFEKAEQFLDSFSFTDLVQKLVRGIFGFVNEAAAYVVDFFTFDSPEGESTSIMDIVNDTVDRAIKFFKKMFDFLPSFDSVTEKIKSFLPDSVLDFFGGDDDEKVEIEPKAKVTAEPRPTPVRDAVVENQMLREQEQATATAAVVDNSNRQSSNTNVQSTSTNVYNTAFVDDVNSSLAFNP